MKIFFALLVTLFSALMTNVAFADEVSPKGGPESLENIFPLNNEKMTLPDFAERLATPQDKDHHDKLYTCRAWTTCPNGRRIWCWSRGYSCYSEYTAGYRVYCSATDYYGYTKYWVYYCY
ncbi:MAG: hypothetical protein ACXVCY_05245 [Pseudobdellovibrionaceae bacterium]